MKKIILLSLLIAHLFITNVLADTELKTSDVFVTATRTPVQKNNIIADTTTITEEEIERAGLSSLPELLQCHRQTSSVEFPRDTTSRCNYVERQ